jgi:hypothetical protein
MSTIYSVAMDEFSIFQARSGARIVAESRRRGLNAILDLVLVPFAKRKSVSEAIGGDIFAGVGWE